MLGNTLSFAVFRWLCLADQEFYAVKRLSAATMQRATTICNSEIYGLKHVRACKIPRAVQLREILRSRVTEDRFFVME